MTETESKMLYESTKANTSDLDFGVMVNCAVRSQLEQNWQDYDIMVCKALHYSLGRKSYMPHLITDYVQRNIAVLNDNTLHIIIRDIEFARTHFNLGDDHIDAPMWMKFRDDIQLELDRRTKTT